MILYFLLACPGPSPPPPALETPPAAPPVCDWSTEGTLEVSDTVAFAKIPFSPVEFSTPGAIDFAPDEMESRTLEVWRELRRVNEGPWRSVSLDVAGAVTQIWAGCPAAPSTTGVIVQGAVPHGGRPISEVLTRRVTNDSVMVTLPSGSLIPDTWMLANAYAAPGGLVRVTGHGAAAGARPSRIGLLGACGHAEADVAAFEQVTLTGSPEAFSLSARDGTVWARLTPGVALREASTVRSDKAAWVELPVGIDAVVTMEGEWRVLCANATHPECEAPRTSKLTLGHGGPELRFEAPRGRVVLYDEPAMISDPLSDCSPSWRAPAAGQAFLRALATHALNESCGDFADERCWDVSGLR